ncbi:MAG: hypothetical protein ACTSVY_14955 [Candidatus Helarchaeota archaeon]
MKVKECSCYKKAMAKFLDKRLSELETEIQEEIKKVLGLNFLGMTSQMFTDARIRDIFKEKSSKFISTFILFNKPIVKFDAERNRYILHVSGCSKIDEIPPIVTEVKKQDVKKTSDDDEKTYFIPIE